MDTSYLTSQVATIIGQLHGLFDEIGVPSHERESREAEVRLAHQPLYETFGADLIVAICRALRNITEPGEDSRTGEE